jgi:uncharacterized iron-regulated membrane protein
MIHLPKHETKLMVAVHGWSGIVLGLLLYAVVFTGMAAVFADEIGTWSAGHVETSSAFERPFDATLRALAARTPARFHEGVDLFEVRDHDLGAFFHHHETTASGELISRGIYYQVGKDGRIDAKAGTNEEVFGPRNDDALSHFLVDTHVRLHLPNPWGLLLTGILGLAMLVAAISGLLIHRHLFKDIFTVRRKANTVLGERDRHSVAGTWSLPFAFILAFTGSFFSFYGTVGVPIVAMAAFGGDIAKLSETVYGNPGTPDPRPQAIGDFDRIAADSIRRAGSPPTYVAIENFGRADAEVTSYHDPAGGGIAPVTLLYDGANARFERAKPSVGTRPSAGGTLAAIMSPLHFGNFAGILSKAVWFALGFAMCYVTLTGLRLWLIRRRQDARSLEWLDRAVSIVGFGLPLGLAAAAAAFLVAMPLGSATYWTGAAFVIAALAAIAGGFLAPSRQMLDRALLGGTGILLLLLPLLRIGNGGPGWPTALGIGQPIIVALDLAFLVAGIAAIHQVVGRARGVAGTPLVLHPAE